MSILNNYIVSRVLKGYVSILCALLGLYVVSDLFFHFKDFLNYNVPFAVTVLYYFYSLPSFTLLISPYALLISVVYSFAELNKNNEILGIRTLGFSMFRLSLSTLVCAMLISTCMLFIQEKVLFEYENRVAQIKTRYLSERKTVFSRSIKNIAFRSDNSIFFIPVFNPAEKTLYDVIIFKKDDQGNINEKLFSQKITYRDGVWIARSLTSYTLEPDGKFTNTPLFWEERVIPLDATPQNLALRKSIYSGFSSLKALHEEIDRLEKIKVTGLLPNLIVELHRHVAEPFAHFFLIIGALPFALEIRKRKVGLSSLAVGLTFGALYFFIFQISLAMGRAETILPALSAWVAPLFFTVIGVSGPFFMK